MPVSDTVMFRKVVHVLKTVVAIRSRPANRLASDRTRSSCRPKASSSPRRIEQAVEVRRLGNHAAGKLVPRIAVIVHDLEEVEVVLLRVPHV